MPLRRGTYWVIWPASSVRHVQAYRETPFPLCSLGQKKGAREVFGGTEEKIEAMPLCRHCVREAERIGTALIDGHVAELIGEQR